MFLSWINRNKKDKKEQLENKFLRVANYYYAYNIDSLRLEQNEGFNKNPYVKAFFGEWNRSIDFKEWKEKFKSTESEILEFGRFLQTYIVIQGGLPADWQTDLMKYEKENLFYTLFVLISPDCPIQKRVRALSHEDFLVRFVAASLLVSLPNPVEKSLEEKLVSIFAEADADLNFWVAATVKPQFQQVIASFFRDPSPQIRMALGANERVSEFAKFAEYLHSDAAFAKGVAGNSKVSVEILWQIFEQYRSSQEVLNALASNSQTPLDILLQLQAERGCWEGLLSNPSLSPAMLMALSAALMAKGEDGLLAKMAQHPNCPVELLRQLAQLPSPTVRLAVALSANRPEDLPPLDVAALRREVEEEVTAALLGKETVKRCLEASDPNTPEPRLRELLQSPATEVRLSLIQNPNCPLSVLLALAKDPEFEVRYQLVRRENLPPMVMEQLSKDPAAAIRLELSLRKDIPPQIAATLDPIRLIEEYSQSCEMLE